MRIYVRTSRRTGVSFSGFWGWFFIGLLLPAFLTAAFFVGAAAIAIFVVIVIVLLIEKLIRTLLK